MLITTIVIVNIFMLDLLVLEFDQIKEQYAFNAF